MTASFPAEVILPLSERRLPFLTTLRAADMRRWWRDCGGHPLTMCGRWQRECVSVHSTDINPSSVSSWRVLPDMLELIVGWRDSSGSLGRCLCPRHSCPSLLSPSLPQHTPLRDSHLPFLLQQDIHTAQRHKSQRNVSVEEWRLWGNRVSLLTTAHKKCLLF